MDSKAFKQIYIYKKSRPFAFAVCLLFILGICFLYTSDERASDSSVLFPEWISYQDDASLPGFAYWLRTPTADLLISSDEELTVNEYSLEKTRVELVAKNSFFNPNACSKMPNTIWNKQFFFRDYALDASASDLNSILYHFTPETNVVRKTFIPNMVGDIFTHADTLYFFLMDESKALYIAHTTESPNAFIVEFLTNEFNEGELQFYSGEPAFQYKHKALSKTYSFDYSGREFVQNPDYKKPLRLSTEGSALVYHFPEKEFMFADTKAFDSRVQSLINDNTIYFKYTGSANLYPIGFQK